MNSTETQPTPATEKVAAPQTNTLRPPATITANEDGYVLAIDLPGVRKEDLTIAFENAELTITGRRSHYPANAKLVFSESAPGEFRRVFELDPAIDATRITARLEDGVLTLSLPKAEQAKPRRIEIHA
jgi:HSP20 family molecular chaperone IbpA